MLHRADICKSGKYDKSMLYFLLIIIAIGVLLASEAGQELLRGLFWLALIAGGLYLTFWIIVIAVALFTSDTGKSFATGAFYLIGIIVVVFCGINYLIKTEKNKEKQVEILEKIKSKISFISKEDWKQHKIKTIFFILSLIFIVVMMILTK